MNDKDEGYCYNVLEKIKHEMPIIRKNEWMNNRVVMDTANEENHSEYTMQQ